MISGDPVMMFHGIPPEDDAWGEDIVYELRRSDSRTMGALGGVPLVDFWSDTGGVAIFNTSTYQQPFTVSIRKTGRRFEVIASGGTHLEVLHHEGDYYDAVRAFALKMRAKGLAVQPAPNWAFNPIWETYGFEEDFDADTITGLIPVFRALGIGTITIDSGWYGTGRGDDIDFATGDFRVNADTIGDEDDLKALIALLHREGFKVRLWWVPGVAEEGTMLYAQNPDWFRDDVISSTGDTADRYLDPGSDQVKAWNRALVRRLLSYGVDGFKQDDIYHFNGTGPADSVAYADLINGNLSTAREIKGDFVINTCNCGIVQNFYQMAGQNQIITSDPVGGRQFRTRAKYLHALNVNNAAVMGDHVELTRGDVGPRDLDRRGFYGKVDFASVVPLGLVLETKFREDPGAHYRKWFAIYHRYKFYRMEWVNIPMRPDMPESYLLRQGNALYYTFFAERDGGRFRGSVVFDHLKPNRQYQVFDIANKAVLATFSATRANHVWETSFTHALVVEVKPVGG